MPNSQRSLPSNNGKSLCLAIALAAAGVCVAQSTANTGKQSGSSPSPSTGFSIETEMLTYRALESNSEAIACDVAGVISGTKPDFDHPTDDLPCTVPTIATSTTIVLLPFEKAELEDFAQWRAAMAELKELQDKAAPLGCPKSQSTARSGTSTLSLDSLLSMSPAGPPLALAENVLGLFQSEEVTASVTGNIQDLAFLNDVARELKALHISVVMPSSYDPGNLAVTGETTSPFLGSKERTLMARGCLAALDLQNNPKAAEIKQTIADIDNYMATFAGYKPVKTENGGSPANNGTNGSGTSNGSKGSGTSTATNNQNPANEAPTEPINQNSANSSGGSSTSAASSMSIILRADGLAQRLGFSFNIETGNLSAPTTGHYILMVKALESGGSVTGRSNILGTKLRYSGGSAGTYALFATGGDLVCSGNVYDYGGSLPAKHFERDLRNVHFDPKEQVIFHAGGCPAEDAAAPAVPSSNPIH